MRSRFFKIMAIALLLTGALTAEARQTVKDHGQLRVEGSRLVDCNGRPVQLRGVSMGWHNMWPRFYNSSTVKALTNDWGADIVRCSIGVSHLDNSLEHSPELAYACVDSIVEAAIANDAYVLVDFHSHPNNLELAKEFFAKVAGKYGNRPNVLYEVWNEPMEVEWAETKAYAEEIVPHIRKYAPEAVVIVPTPRWDQDVDKAAADPVTSVDNIMYSLHYYAATHTDYFRDKAREAIAKGLPIFMSECASMVHTGDGVIDTASWEEWMKMADDNGISWIAWSISDKDETCSMLRPSADSRGELWKAADLKPWAVLVRYYLNLGRD